MYRFITKQYLHSTLGMWFVNKMLYDLIVSVIFLKIVYLNIRIVFAMYKIIISN